MTQHPVRRLLSFRFLNRARVRQEMDAEIDAHLQMRIDDLVRTGLSPDRARAEAQRRFGDASARRNLHRGAEQRNRALHRRDMLGALLADLRFAARQARRAPGFTAISVLTIGLGIGLTTSTLTLAQQILLRPLPFPADEQLVSLGSMDSTRAGFPRVSSANWRDWTTTTQSLSATAILQEATLSVATDAGAVAVPAQSVTADFFRTLQPRFLLGRSFGEDDVRSGEPVVVVSESFWRRMLGEDSSLAAPLRGTVRSFRVAGVLAAGQEFPAGTDVWIPTAPRAVGRNNINWSAIARVRDGVPLGRVRTELDAAAAQVQAAYPQGLYSWGVDVVPLKKIIVGDASRYLLLLFAASALVLLIACANVAAANLGRGAARGRELAVRTAIGAGRERLIRQLLAEHLAIGLAAGALGLGLAWIAIQVMIARWGASLPRVAEVRMDVVVLVTTLCVAVLSGVITGILPALAGSRASLVSLLSAGARGSATGGRGLPTRALVVAQIATAVVLATGSTMLLRSFTRVLSRDLGFDPAVVTAEATLNTTTYRGDTARAYAYWDALRSTLGAIPGVRSVALSNRPPLLSGGTGFIEVEDQSHPGASAGYRVISDGYLEAMRIPLSRGRAFTDADGAGAERVAIINETMARRYWPGDDPLGKRVRALSMEPSFSGGQSPWIRIVGVAGDVRHYGLERDILPEMFVHYRQVPLWAFAMTAIVRPAGDAEPMTRTVADHARRVDPLIPVTVGTLEGRFRETLSERAMIASLITTFGVVAMLLAALGTYGMLSYAVARRTRELAIRSALGAQRSTIVHLVLSSAGRVAVAGIAVGVVGSLVLARLIASQLVDVSPHDAFSLVAGAGALAAIALIASLPPVMRAIRVSPLMAMREE